MMDVHLRADAHFASTAPRYLTSLATNPGSPVAMPGCFVARCCHQGKVKEYTRGISRLHGVL